MSNSVYEKTGRFEGIAYDDNGQVLPNGTANYAHTLDEAWQLLERRFPHVATNRMEIVEHQFNGFDYRIHEKEDAIVIDGKLVQGAKKIRPYGPFKCYAELCRVTPVLGTIINDKVGTIMIDGTIVADFCEVDGGWFHTTRCDENGESIEGDDFTGDENQILEHYSKPTEDQCTECEESWQEQLDKRLDQKEPRYVEGSD